MLITSKINSTNPNAILSSFLITLYFLIGCAKIGIHILIMSVVFAHINVYFFDYLH